MACRWRGLERWPGRALSLAAITRDDGGRLGRHSHSADACEEGNCCEPTRRPPYRDPPQFFDLIELPPTEAEFRQANEDRKEGWEERLTDRLLASPHFGEQWGRHWLDVARYGEDDFGGTAARPYPNACFRLTDVAGNVVHEIIA